MTPAIRLGIFNHVSMYFADVVWTGLSTQNVRQAFAGNVSQEELRQYWSVISPASYLERFQGRDLKTLLIWASHDSTFLPVYSKQVLDSFRDLKLPHTGLQPSVRPLHHRTVPVQPDGRLGHVPFRRPQPVTLTSALSQVTGDLEAGLGLQLRVDRPPVACQDMVITEKGGGPAKWKVVKDRERWPTVEVVPLT